MGKKTKILLLEFCILLVICRVNSTLFIGFIWALGHEAAHIFVGQKFKITFYDIKLHLAGVKAEMGDLDTLTDFKKILVYFAGPLFNIIAVLFLIFLKKVYDIEINKEFIFINSGLFIFNLLPAYPLDGIRIYEILLSRRILYKSAKKILINISFAVSLIIVIIFSLTVYIHRANFSLLLAAILITYSTLLEKENIMYILMGNIFKKRSNILKQEYMENKSISVYYKKSLLKVLSLYDKNKFNSFFVLDEELQLLGVLYENEIIDALKEYGNITLEELIKIKNEQ